MATPDPTDDRPDAARRGAEWGESVARGDWPAQAADAVVNAVDGVRDKTTGPALKVARGVVYGLLILIMAVVAVVLLIVGLIRFLQHWFEVWQVYLGLGALFTLLGILLYRLRAPEAPDVTDTPNPAPGNRGRARRG